MAIAPGCGWVSMTFHTPGTPRGYPPRQAARAILIEPEDVPALFAAGGEVQGTAELRGHIFVHSPRMLLQRAERKLARRGVTHFLYDGEGVYEWDVSRPGMINTRCQGFGCTTVYRPPTTTRRSRRVVLVIRFVVPQAAWPSLPAHLQPVPAG
jgi:hypothetical protein